MFVDHLGLGLLWKRLVKGKENGEVKWFWGTADDTTEVVRDQEVKTKKWGTGGESSRFQRLGMRLGGSLVWPGLAVSVLITIIVMKTFFIFIWVKPCISVHKREHLVYFILFFLEREGFLIYRCVIGDLPELRGCNSWKKNLQQIFCIMWEIIRKSRPCKSIKPGRHAVNMLARHRCSASAVPAALAHGV